MRWSLSFKYMVDLLSSVASIVAIVSVLVAWYQSRRKPLKIKRVLVHQKEKSTRVFLYLINRAAYPVNIKSIKCFKKISYQVLQKNDYCPERVQQLDYKDFIFQTQQKDEIEAFANCHVVVDIGHLVQVDSKQLILSLQTSHGYHLLKVNDIDVVRMGVASAAYLVPFEKVFDSSIKARLYHFFKVSQYYIGKSFKKKN